MSQLWDKKYNTKLEELFYYIDENQKVRLTRHGVKIREGSWKEVVKNEPNSACDPLHDPIYKIKVTDNTLVIDLV